MLQPPPCLLNGLVLLRRGILCFVSKVLTVSIRPQNPTWNAVAYLYAFKQITYLKFLHKDNQNYSNYYQFQKIYFELPSIKKSVTKKNQQFTQTLKLFAR